ncbi:MULTISPECIES: MMPL family transporter [Brevibacterium]|jgi:RND superfamily putative drug exporter|uniref:MMPL family transporter n=1 Tax=Brevibacterium casei TaxID=33889 RepID=A0A7T4DJH8_9MICO|nr:efflux RND transporter permease subunit [Brevibacterium casei]QQB15470.1 MMPL family transporter [Brevibacterium casei]
MFEPAARPPRALRILIPTVLILIWLAVFGVGGMSFGDISDVASDERSSFLPDSAESTRVQAEITTFTGSDAIPAIVIAERTGGLTDDDLTALERLGERAENVIDGASTSPVIPADDGDAAQLVVAVPADAEIGDAVTALEAESADILPDDLGVWVSGPAGFTADLQEAFGGIDGILLLVALAVVFVILIIVYRSPLLPILVLLSSMTALCAAVLINVALARADLVTLNGQVQGILFILVIGAATDYSLLCIARYREELSDNRLPFHAAVRAVRGVCEPIAASGGTVIVGLLCLLLSDLGSNSALGPVAAVGIVCAVLTSLTFLPALLIAAGRVAFWPRAPKFGSAHPILTGAEATGIWARMGRTVAGAPKRMAAGVTVVLILGCGGLLLLDAQGVPQNEFVLGSSQARDGQEVIDRHFSGGSGTPAYVLAEADERAEVAAAIAGTEGVDSLALVAQDSPAGTIPVDETGEVSAEGPRGSDAAEPTEIDGQLMFSVTLSDPADSLEAEQTIRDMREGLESSDALVGGSTAVDLDTNDTSVRDRAVIIPIVLVVITIMLALLLRSLVAPVVLLATTVLSFGTALGLSAVIFQFIGQPQSDPSVPLYAFVFLVALGIDYTIFLMTRVREESLEHGTRQGTLRGLSVTGGVITSAGVVLAATFAALIVIPIQFLLQLAIIVSLGVLLDALIVRTLLVPALAIWIGDCIWWPSRLAGRFHRGRPSDTDDPSFSPRRVSQRSATRLLTQH